MYAENALILTSYCVASVGASPFFFTEYIYTYVVLDISVNQFAYTCKELCTYKIILYTKQVWTKFISKINLLSGLKKVE